MLSVEVLVYTNLILFIIHSHPILVELAHVILVTSILRYLLSLLMISTVERLLRELVLRIFVVYYLIY